MTPMPQGPRVPYAEQFPATYKDAVSQAFAAGGTAERFRAMVRYDREQETTREIEEHLNQMLPLIRQYGQALDVAMTRLGVNSIEELLPSESPTQEIPVVPDELYLPADWTI